MGGIAGGGGGKGGGGGGGGGGGDAFGLDTGGGGSFGGGGFSDPMSGLSMGSGGGDIGPIGGSFDDPSTIFANPLVGASESMGGGGPAQALASMGGGGGGEFTGGDTGQQPSGAPQQQQGQSQQPTFVQPPQPPQQQAAAPSPNAPQSAGWFTTPAQAAEYRPDFNQTFGQFPTDVPTQKGDLLSTARGDQPVSFADRFSAAGAAQAAPAVPAFPSSGALSYADPTSPAFQESQGFPGGVSTAEKTPPATASFDERFGNLPPNFDFTSYATETGFPATETPTSTTAEPATATPDTTSPTTTTTDPQTGTPRQATGGRQQQRQVSPIQAIIDLLSGKPQGLQEMSQILKGMGQQTGNQFSPNLQDLNRQVGNDYGAPGGPMAQGQTPGAREPTPSFAEAAAPTFARPETAPTEPEREPAAPPAEAPATATAPQRRPDDILAGSQHEGGYGLTPEAAPTEAAPAEAAAEAPETVQTTAPTGAGTAEIAPAAIAPDRGAPPTADAGPTLSAMAPGMSQVPIPLRRPPGAPQPTAPTTAWPPQPRSIANTPLTAGRALGQIPYASGKIGAPSQPSVNRSQFRNQINDQIAYKLAWMINGEVGRGAPLQAKIVQAETAFNRAQMRNDTLSHSLLGVGERVHYRNPQGQNAGPYYARGTYSAQAKPNAADIALIKNQILPAIMNGSNLSDVGHGPMTGNASAGLAARQMQKMFGYKLNGGDHYFAEGPLRRLPTNEPGQPAAQQPGAGVRTDQLPRQHLAALTTGDVSLPGNVPPQQSTSELLDLMRQIDQERSSPGEQPLEYRTLPGSPAGTPYDFGINDALID